VSGAEGGGVAAHGKGMSGSITARPQQPAPVAATEVGGAKVCSILDPDCEACQ